MANSGGKRSDLDADENLTIGEVRTLRFTVKDADDADVNDFTGWQFEWFLLTSLDKANGLTALRAGNLVHKENGDITATSPPTVDVPLGTGDWPSKAGSHYGHELWRVDTGNVRRLSYGRFVVID